jgi:hypothetical protein
MLDRVIGQPDHPSNQGLPQVTRMWIFRRSALKPPIEPWESWMTLKFLAPAAMIAAILVGYEAHAESCKVESASPAGQWKFIRAYDADTGKVVFQQALNGGDSRPVTVSGERVRVDYKLPGHTVYQTGAVAPCKGGNSVKT